MPFELPSIADIRDFVVAQGRVLFPTLNFGSRRSYHGKRATFLAGALGQLFFHTDSAQRDLHPLTAGDGKPINDWGAAIGVARKGATPARRSAAGRVRGNAAATALAGRQMRHDATGLLFQLGNNVTIPGVFGVDPDSFFDADIIAVDTGSQTRLLAGETLKFLSTPAGMQASVILQLDLDQDGFDEEQFGSYRGRFLSTFSQTPSGGNQNDFVKWVLESLPSIRRAYAYPNRAGRGTIDLVGFYTGTGTARTLTSPDRAAVLAYVQSKAPFQVSGTGGGLRVLTTVTDPQRVEITLQTNGITAFGFDWVDSVPLVVLSWTPTTRALRMTTALPASLRAGHRLIIDGQVGGSGVNAQDGREFKIESISATDTVILEVAPPVAPGATDKIYSGGPLVTPIRDAIVAHLNGEIVYAGRGLTPIPESKAAPVDPFGPSIIGLDELVQGIGPSNPGGLFGSWSGGIVLSQLFKIATYKAGVRKANIIAPVADYEPVNDAFPSDSQIHYVTPSAIIIRSV